MTINIQLLISNPHLPSLRSNLFCLMGEHSHVFFRRLKSALHLKTAVHAWFKHCRWCSVQHTSFCSLPFLGATSVLPTPWLLLQSFCNRESRENPSTTPHFPLPSFPHVSPIFPSFSPNFPIIFPSRYGSNPGPEVSNPEQNGSNPERR